MKKLLCILLCIVLIPILSACSGGTHEASFEAMDTVMSLKVVGDDVCGRLEARAHELDRLLSSTDADSDIFRLNESGSATLHDDALTLVRRSLELSAELPSYFDPTVYPAVLEWGFIDSKFHVPDDHRLAELVSLIDSSAVSMTGDTVSLKAGMAIDLGAVAKGYLADECRTILSDSKAKSAVLNLGGTILLYGKKSDGSDYKVGVADPENPAAYFGYLTCREGVIATSGGYERYFEKDGKRYIHILDPTTAAPVDNGVLSVTVYSRDGVLSDALSTALFVMGQEQAAAYYRAHSGFDYILLTDDGRLYLTEGVADNFSLSDGYDLERITISRED